MSEKLSSQDVQYHKLFHSILTCQTVRRAKSLRTVTILAQIWTRPRVTKAAVRTPGA